MRRWIRKVLLLSLGYMIGRTIASLILQPRRRTPAPLPIHAVLDRRERAMDALRRVSGKPYAEWSAEDQQAILDYARSPEMGTVLAAARARLSREFDQVAAERRAATQARSSAAHSEGRANE